MRWGSRRAIFLDKDGTLVENVAYNVDPRLIRWHDGVLDSLAELKRAGFELIVVTNQSGLAQGRFTDGELKHYLAALSQRVETAGAPLTGIYYCPHPRADDSDSPACSCRKPKPGMIHRAALELGLDLPRSWMVGDLLDDVEAGHRAGCHSALVEHDGNEAIPCEGVRAPDLQASSLALACETLLSTPLALS